MSSLVFKTTLGIVSVGGVVGGGILIGNYLSSKEDTRFTMGELVSKSKTKILVNDDASWGKLWDKYKADNQNNGVGKDTWNLSEWKGASNPITVPKSYKERCTSLSGTTVEGESDPKYLEFLNRCARDKSVGDLLKGFTLLSKDNGNEAKWKNRFKKYKEAKTGTDIYPIVGIVLGVNDSENTEEHLQKLQDSCATQRNKSVTGNEEESYLEAVKTWCSAEVIKNDS